jgi:citrate lyase subunit beta/citryl-CoA lyase
MSAPPSKRDMNGFVRRSSLIFPVNVPRFVEKAYTRGADCVIMDLEDSVPEVEKDSARALVKGSIPVVSKGGGDVAVRINRPLKEARRGLLSGSVQLAVSVETALGVIRAFEIASASPRIVTIGVGAEHLTQEMGVQTSVRGEELWYARSKVLMDAYAASVQPMDLIGVEPFSWREPEKAYDAAINSRSLGYKGAQSIHPAPIPHINRGFSIP